ncbi:hypothetical protein FJZ31_06285 [Candidatus Poribacteria bacterium]|nr:hypothetical protein [Candidatus Poribacteria bacterium]
MQSKLIFLFFIGLLVISVSFAFSQEEFPDILKEIKMTKKPPTIDGNLEEWKYASAMFISDTSTQPLDDCSGTLYMMWDESNLYFAAKINDESILQNERGADIWKGDDVQFDLDLDWKGAEKESPVFDDLNQQIGFSPGNLKDNPPTIWGWNPGGKRTIDNPKDAEIETAEFQEEKYQGYIIEARIGIDDLSGGTLKKFFEGMKIGVGRCINDYDARSEEGGVSSEGAWNNPQKMNGVELVGPMSVKASGQLLATWAKIKLAK